MLHSTSAGINYIYTRIDPEISPLRRLNYYSNKGINNNILELNSNGSLMMMEGVVKAKWLSDVKHIVNNGKISCDKDSCAVSRFFYKDGDVARFNYKVNHDQFNNSRVRIKLPGIYIHKYSTAFDNNSVYPGQEITYTIKIVNNSQIRKVDGGSSYPNFYVSEDIPLDKVEFVSSNGGILNNNSLTWNVSSIDPGSSLELQYTVRVKDTALLVGQKVNSIGKVYLDNTGYITTGEISNTIIRKVVNKKDSYLNCYDRYINDQGVSLINNVYKCVYGVDLELDKFNSDKMMSNLIYVNPGAISYTDSKKIKLINSDSTGKYYDMILNDYWNALPVYQKNGNYFYSLPNWEDNDDMRATTIDNRHFRDGDVLIYVMDNTYTKSNLKYVNENGLYAYIYLNGKFIGRNGNGIIKRDEYTYSYYNISDRASKLYGGSQTDELLTYANYQALMGKDYYVILRPEKIIKEVDNIEVSKLPNKITYNKGENLDLTGGVITLNNNDSSYDNISLENKDVKISNYEKDEIGKQDVVVNYGDKEATFNVEVIAKESNKDVGNKVVQTNKNTLQEDNSKVDIKVSDKDVIKNKLLDDSKELNKKKKTMSISSILAWILVVLGIIIIIIGIIVVILTKKDNDDTIYVDEYEED